MAKEDLGQGFSGKLPLVSILMPSYNTADFIADSIRSVQAQTYQNWELLIVDDCSKDASEEVIRPFTLQDSRVKFFKLPTNGGAAEARNKALEEARGRFIAFLDSDDLWLPRKLEKQIGLMLENQWPFSFTAYRKISEQGEPGVVFGAPKKISYRGLLKTNIIGCLTAVYDAEILGKTPMPKIRKRQDFGLWLSLLKKTPFAYGVSEVLAQYRVREVSISANKKAAAFYNWHLYRKIEGLSLPVSCWYFANYAIRGFLRTRSPWLARVLGVLD